jgi:Eco57I restriction-modification methylase/MmeI, target recognition domain
MTARAEIRAAPDDTPRTVQEERHRIIEDRLTPVRTIGDAVISAFFAADKPKGREKERAKVESWLAGGSLQDQWEKLGAAASSLRAGEHPILPFHWEIEFPEVFKRENSGFDAIVGNPPFAGKNTIISGNDKHYLSWLQGLHANAHGNADLVAHFFRRAFGLLRASGVFGLIATNTIGQGDTRASGLTTILSNGGGILRTTRRLKWPGEAAVTVSVVHVTKGKAREPVLDGRAVRRISAYLVEGDLDTSPPGLAQNSRKSFKGSELHGMGFCFDDAGASKGLCESIAYMQKLIVEYPACAERIKPFITGEDVNSNARQLSIRFAFDLGDLSLQQAKERYPALLALAKRLVYPHRQADNRQARRENWWKFGERASGLYSAISGKDRVLCTLFTSSNLNFSLLPADVIFANAIVATTFEGFAPFAVLQSRIHECWARFFSSTLEDRLRYAPSDCFRTFPFPEDFEKDVSLEATGEAYHAFRAQLMIERNEGLTKTYNRFHARGERAPDIARLRALHAEMDAAVLHAYGWDDLADLAVPEFIEQDADEGKTAKTRFDWPSEFKDEVLARLLALNAEQAAAERAAGLTAILEDEDAEIDDAAVA